MTSRHVLDEVFSDLAGKADDVTARTEFTVPRSAGRITRERRWVVPAAATAAVAGLATAAVFATQGGDSARIPPADGSTPAHQTGKPELPRKSVPDTPRELTEGLRAILGDTATFTVTGTGPGTTKTPQPPSAGNDPGRSKANGFNAGASIDGTLTASGVTGRFRLSAHVDPIGQGPCGQMTNCEVLPDGTHLITSVATLNGEPYAEKSHSAQAVRVNGLHVNMFVTNAPGGKGGTGIREPEPPLTVEQVAKIVTADRW